MTTERYDLFAKFENNICTEMYHVPESQWEDWKARGWIQADPPVGCPGKEYYEKRSEPVAWIDNTELLDGFVLTTVSREQMLESDIPLYIRPPVKELTDEEIIKTMVQFDVYSNDDQCLIEAGRAILRKAQEKC